MNEAVSCSLSYFTWWQPVTWEVWFSPFKKQGPKELTWLVEDPKFRSSKSRAYIDSSYTYILIIPAIRTLVTEGGHNLGHPLKYLVKALMKILYTLHSLLFPNFCTYTLQCLKCYSSLSRAEMRMGLVRHFPRCKIQGSSKKIETNNILIIYF